MSPTTPASFVRPRADAASRRAERELGRADAIRAIGQSLAGGRSASRHVIDATRDPALLVRIEALEALRDIGDPRSFAAARACLRDRSSLVRSYAAVAVAVIDPARARALLGRAVRNDRSSTARVGYVDALFTLGERERLGDLLKLLKSRQYRVRCAAANTLATLDLTTDECVVVRRAVGVALAVEPTIAARSSLKRALRVLRRRAVIQPRVDGGLPPGLDVSNREQMMDWIQSERESRGTVTARMAAAARRAARAAARPPRRAR